MPDSQNHHLNLTIHHASKSYHGIPALIDAHLELNGGGVHGLVGENGAGKSTLIKLLAGVLDADSLHVTYNGKSVPLRNAHDAHHLGLRFIHQELNIVPRLSVAENIFISHGYPRFAGLFVNWRKLYALAEKTLAQIGITHIDVRQLAANLSVGDAMLVKIASAVVGDDLDNQNPAERYIYVMDEPTAALTQAETTLLFAVIERLKQQGCAILYVTHRLDELTQIAQKVTVMRDGAVIGTYPMVETSHDDLIQGMTGRQVTQVFPPRETAIQAEKRLEVMDLASSQIRDVHFDVRAGEIVGIAGLNGSGRSEVLRAIFGVDALDHGRIILDGQPLKNLSPAQAWQHGIAFVPEERRTQGLVLTASISDNMTLPHLNTLSYLRSLLNHRAETKLSQAMSQQVQLKGTGIQQHVKELSGGNQQKTLFGRALLNQPKVVMLDEPTRGVDVGAKQDIYRLIRQLSAQGVSIVMVSSELGELIGLCDRILIMRNRQLVNEVSPVGLSEEALLSLCYGMKRGTQA